MRNRTVLATWVLLATSALVTPAGAVTVNGVDYTLLAKRGILMQASDDCPHAPFPPPGKVCMSIVGNVGVSDPPNPADSADGRLQIGSNNDIAGLARAHNIVFGTLSETDTCNFDIASGVAPNPPVCHTKSSPALLPLVPAWPPGPLGAVPVAPCVNAAANVTAAIGATLALAPGCYKDVRVNAGGTLNLTSGSYIFKSLFLKAGSTLNGGGTTVNVQGQTISEVGVRINDATIETPGTAAQTVSEFIIIGKGNALVNVSLYAPTAAIHVHLGTTGAQIEVVANFITVGPIITFREPPFGSGCFEAVEKVGSTVTLTGGNKLDLANRFFLSLTCDLAGAIEVTPLSVSPSSTTLDVSGKPAGTYHVIAQWPTGTSCNNRTITVP